ncbi:MAG: GNAT family N-acetyltransferase [Candidatus Heimdallarchaeota archaeon]|nr:GNAT family N-acetyltransferase [Candidatus Heimdallarchaeota archaeon]
MSFEIIDIEPHSESDELLNLYLDLDDKIRREYFPKDPITPREVSLEKIKQQIPGILDFRKAILDKQRNIIIARLILKMFTKEHQEYQNNKHIAEVDINVIREYRNEEYSEILFKEAIKIIKTYKGISVVEGCCIWKQEWEMWQKHGAKETYSADVNRVYLDEIDWNMMNDWREKGLEIAKAEEISLEIFENCPEEIIEEYTTLYYEILTLVPWGDMEWSPPEETPEYRRIKEERQAKMGKKWYTIITKEKDGKISGLTEILYNPKDDYWVHQILTGVKPEYRSRGLGKWLKAEMLFFIQEKLPEAILIHTGNAEVNAPMLSINERMGFKRYLTDKCFTVKLENIL